MLQKKFFGIDGFTRRIDKEISFSQPNSLIYNNKKIVGVQLKKNDEIDA